MKIRYIRIERQLPDELELEISEESGLNVIIDFPTSIRILRKRTLANGYGEFYDLHGNVYYISPEAQKTSRRNWTGVQVLDEFYIYVKDEEE